MYSIAMEPVWKRPGAVPMSSNDWLRTMAWPCAMLLRSKFKVAITVPSAAVSVTVKLPKAMVSLRAARSVTVYSTCGWNLPEGIVCETRPVAKNLT